MLHHNNVSALLILLIETMTRGKGSKWRGRREFPSSTGTQVDSDGNRRAGGVAAPQVPPLPAALPRTKRRAKRGIPTLRESHLANDDTRRLELATTQEPLGDGRDENITDVEERPPQRSTTVAVIDAYLVVNESNRVDVLDAVIVENKDLRFSSDKQKMILLFVGAFLLVAVITTVTLVIPYSRNGIQSVDPPSPAPTTSTGRFADIVTEILTHFDSSTLAQDLTNPDSPQYRAALWMAEQDEHPATADLLFPLNRTSLDLLQFRQRYAIVTIFYATGGNGWTDTCNFLTPSLHVCEWRCPWNLTYYAYFYGYGDVVTDQMGVNCGIHFNDSHPMFKAESVFDDLVLSLELGTQNQSSEGTMMMRR